MLMFCAAGNVNILVLISIQNLSPGSQLAVLHGFVPLCSFQRCCGPPRVDFSYNIFLTLSARAPLSVGQREGGVSRDILEPLLGPLLASHSFH